MLLHKEHLQKRRLVIPSNLCDILPIEFSNQSYVILYLALPEGSFWNSLGIDIYFLVVQAKYLLPDAMKVQELAALLEAKQIGVVAHFYMDPEVQGVLVAAQQLWPHIHISDSLVMADRAVSMANAGCKHIAVLGVDFMSENVRAILDRAGHEKVSCELLQI